MSAPRRTSKPKGISRRKFADLDGCDESLVRRGLTQGKLKAFRDGTIDPALAGTDWRERRPEQRTGYADTSANSADSPHGAEQPETFAEAQRRKEIALANKHELDVRVREGKLVDRAMAEKLFFDTSLDNRNAWIAWPARIAVELADRLKVDSRILTAELSALVNQHLAEMGEPHAAELAS